MTHDLWVVGDYAWDVLIRTNTELLAGGDTYGEVSLASGGAAANAAVWARRCGASVAFVGKIGRDRLGDLAEEELKAEGIDAWLVRSETQTTGSVAVWIDHNGQRSMVSGKGADHYLLSSELPREHLARARTVLLTGWSFFADPPREAVREAARLAKTGGATLVFDPASFQLIETVGVERFVSWTADLGIDLLFPNYDEGCVLSGETEPEAIVARLSELYRGARVILKLDAKGAYVQADEHGQGGGRIAPVESQLLDATGAGDAFVGSFLARREHGAEPLEAARFAAGVSAWVIEHLGARPAPDAALRARIAAADDA